MPLVHTHMILLRAIDPCAVQIWGSTVRFGAGCVSVYCRPESAPSDRQGDFWVGPVRPACVRIVPAAAAVFTSSVCPLLCSAHTHLQRFPPLFFSAWMRHYSIFQHKVFICVLLESLCKCVFCDIPSEHTCIQEERVQGELWLCKIHHTLIMILISFPRESLPGEAAHTLLKWQTSRAAAAGVWETVTWLKCMRNLTQSQFGLLLYAAVSVEIRCDWGWSSGAGEERRGSRKIHVLWDVCGEWD